MLHIEMQPIDIEYEARKEELKNHKEYLVGRKKIIEEMVSSKEIPEDFGKMLLYENTNEAKRFNEYIRENDYPEWLLIDIEALV